MTTKIQWSDEIKKRFWAKVIGTDRESDCWCWGGGLFTNGYGQFRIKDKKLKAHRVVYMFLFGEIPLGMIICHHCDNKRCVNPSHLFLGTHKDNAQDRDRKGRTGDGGSKYKKEQGSVQGIKNAAHKINPLIVRTIRKYRRCGHTYSALQDGIEFSFGIKISKSQIANIVHKRSWSHVR